MPGVVNDPETKTVRFEVTDDGKGKLTVVCLESPFTASTAFTFTNRCVVVPDNSANDEIGPGAGDKPLNSNGDADSNAGDVVSPSAGMLQVVLRVAHRFPRQRRRAMLR